MHSTTSTVHTFFYVPMLIFFSSVSTQVCIFVGVFLAAVTTEFTFVGNLKDYSDSIF